MDAGTKKIQEIFLNNIILKIPYFQRSYVWKEENWERFLDDMLDLTETNEKYFIGSVILKKAGTNEMGYDQYDVVDGQQRLTTLVIFSKILYLMAGKNDKFENKFFQDDSKDSILRPNRKDAAVFNSIVSLESLGTQIAGSGQVKEAFLYFCKKLNSSEYKEKANKLIQSMNNNVLIVRIIVDENENEQQIFDTINSLGQDLTTGELLKNYLFDDNNTNLYDEKWAPVFENGGNDYSYWTDQLTKGRLKSNNIENFFYHFMLVKMQEPNLKNQLNPIEKKQYRKQEGLFESYKNLIRKHQIDKNTLINEIVEYANIYHSNFNQSILQTALVKYAGIERLSFLLFAQNSWTAVPYLLYILENVTDQKERTKIFEYLESYIVRRIICKSKNNSYSDLFSECLVGQAINTYEKLRKYLTDPMRGTLLIPSDEDVKTAVGQNNLSKEACLILYLYESKINSNFTGSESLDNGYLDFSSEALMPLKYDEKKWPISDNVTKEERERLVKTLGNFTLIRGGNFPKSKKESSWKVKRDFLDKVTEDLQTLRFSSFQEWNENQINKRNKGLSDKIIEIWSI